MWGEIAKLAIPVVADVIGGGDDKTSSPVDASGSGSGDGSGFDMGGIMSMFGGLFGGGEEGDGGFDLGGVMSVFGGASESGGGSLFGLF
jgi:hypothetical protein